jgi:hypothetical protein
MLLFRLVHVTACCRSDRLLTAEAMFDREIDPHAESGSRVLDELGAGIVDDREDWSRLIGFAAGTRADDLTVRAKRIHQDEEMDCFLLGYSLAQADERSLLLVTNDEVLLISARGLLERLQTTDRAPTADFMVMHTVNLMRCLLQCGAISMDVMEGALLAEWEHVSQRCMGERKRKKKLDRLMDAARRLQVSLPDPDRPFDDSDLLAEFLGKVDDHGY